MTIEDKNGTLLWGKGKVTKRWAKCEEIYSNDEKKHRKEKLEADLVKEA